MKFAFSSLNLFFLAAMLQIESVSAVDFAKDIQPILKDHCYKCHSGPKAKRKIRYDDIKYFQKVIGTESHHVVVPGDPDRSLMLKLASLPQTSTDAMPPPRRGKALNSAELALLRKWIADGASFESKADNPSSSGPDRNSVQEWTNTKGKTLRAVFVAVEGSYVKLRKEDGIQISYPLDSLSSESKKLIEQFTK